MSSRKYVASFEVSPSGDLIPRELSTRITELGRVVMVIDEASRKIYLWLGSGSSLNNRMVAKRMANSIPIFGLKVEGLDFPLGRDCKIIEIDESLSGSDKSTSSHMAELRELLKKTYLEMSEGVWYTAEKPSEKKGENEKVEARILEERMLYEMSHLEKEAFGKDKKRKPAENKE